MVCFLEVSMITHGSLKSLLSLWENLALNQRYNSLVSFEDIETFQRRALEEGLPFLMQALPTIGKALDHTFATGKWVPPAGFKTRQVEILLADSTVLRYTLSPEWGKAEVFSAHIPIFLGNAVHRALRGESIAVDCVRQLTYIFYKYEVRHEEHTVEEFLQKFKTTDASLPTFEGVWCTPPRMEIRYETVPDLVQYVLPEGEVT
jgi:hypothetical protein